MGLLDSVFEGFIKTNKHRQRHYTMGDLFSIARSPFKHYFRFEHLSIPYLATVFTYKGYDYDWLNIKLCNNGFVYTPRAGDAITRHKSDTWIVLPASEALKWFSFLSSTVKPFYKSARVFYNYAEQRTDIKLYPTAPSTPALLVTFEPGSPYMDDNFEPGNFGLF